MNVVNMQQPKMVVRKSIPSTQLAIMQENLLNLNYWPFWNKFANRILSENQGELSVNQRIDLHRIVARQLIEDMWLIREINRGNSPQFVQLVMVWKGQTINGRTAALAIKNLTIDITILMEDDGGVEITAWWEITRLSKVLVFGNKVARQIVNQIFDDLTEYGINRYTI